MTGAIVPINFDGSSPEEFDHEFIHITHRGELTYYEFKVEGSLLAASCTREKAHGQTEFNVYLGLNYLQDPPRFEQFVTAIQDIPVYPSEKVDCGGGSGGAGILNFWAKVYKLAHRPELISGRGKLLIKIPVVREGENYAHYRSRQDLDDIARAARDSANDPAPIEDLSEVSQFGSGIRESTDIVLIHRPK